MLAPDGVGDFGHVNRALRVDGDAMGGDELAWAFPLILVAELAHQVSLQVEDGHAVAQSGGIVHAAHSVQFSNVDVVLPENHGVGPVYVVPHGDEVAFGVENLNSVGFPVHHVDLVIGVDGDIVGPDELAGVDSGAAPRELEVSRAAGDNRGVLEREVKAVPRSMCGPEFSG